MKTENINRGLAPNPKELARRPTPQKGDPNPVGRPGLAQGMPMNLASTLFERRRLGELIVSCLLNERTRGKSPGKAATRLRKELARRARKLLSISRTEYNEMFGKLETKLEAEGGSDDVAT